MAQEYNVRAVDRALQVLDLFADGASNFPLTEIARGIELSPSTTLRLLTTLEKRNYIYRSEENIVIIWASAWLRSATLHLIIWILSVLRDLIWII